MPTGFDTVIQQLRGGTFGTWRRRGWNGKGMFISLITPPNPDFLPYIAIHTADQKRVPWLASQTDMLAMDWEVAD